MSKRNTIGVIVVILIAVVAVSVFLLTKYNRDKALGLLHVKKVSLSAGDENLRSPGLAQMYYDLSGYSVVWSCNSGDCAENRKMLLNLLSGADSLGLNSSDYHYRYLSRFNSLSYLQNFESGKYETENELVFTDAALSFLFDVAYGKEIKQFKYKGVKYAIDTVRLLHLYDELLEKRNPQAMLDSIEPRLAAYQMLKKSLSRLNTAQREPVLVTPGYTMAAAKLKAYGLLAEQDSVSEEEMKAALVSFQQMTGLDTTARMDSATVEALNIPIAKRISAIEEALNYWRWTSRLREREFIYINIAAARLRIVSRDSLTDTGMRVIVGKPETKTPSFATYLTQVITYPYWTVPLGIATKEMLPKIVKDKSYLDENSLTVLNYKGEEVDPDNIRWKKLSENNFPYTIRQGTGCDNSLGVLKFDLNSPFSIYLHDTNNRNLFGKKNRFLSHGCVRVEKPKELAHFLLNSEEDSIQIARVDSCMKDQEPNQFRVKKQLPVILLYLTADADENNNLVFYKDVYGREAAESNEPIAAMKKKPGSSYRDNK